MPQPESRPEILFAVFSDGVVLTSPADPLPQMSDAAFGRIADAFCKLAASQARGAGTKEPTEPRCD